MHAVFEWLDSRNAGISGARQLLSHVRFGNFSSLALFELPELLRKFLSRASNSHDDRDQSNLSSDATSVSDRQWVDELLEALRKLYSLFILPDRTLSEIKFASAESSCPNGSPLRYLLSLNPNSFLPRCSLNGVVAFSLPDRKIEYYALTPRASVSSSPTISSDQFQSSNNLKPSHLLSTREAPYFFRFKLPDEYRLVNVGASSLLNAFFTVHWCRGVDAEQANTSRLQGSSSSAQTGESELSPSNSAEVMTCRTVLSIFFPNKLALCFSTGLADLAVPRYGGALVMVRVQTIIYPLLIVRRVSSHYRALNERRTKPVGD